MKNKMTDTTNPSLNVYSKENSIKWSSNGGCDDTARPWVVNQVRELAKQGKRTLLDIGCGTGRWTKQFASCLDNVVGLDITPEMIQIAQETNPANNLTYIEGNILTRDLGKFDIATALAMLQHTKTREELAQVYSKIKDSLNPNGHFLFYAPHPMNIYGINTSVNSSEFDRTSSYGDNFPFVAHIAMKDGTTRTGSGYHHSIQEYLGELARVGFRINKIEELISKGDKTPSALVVDAIKD